LLELATWLTFKFITALNILKLLQNSWWLKSIDFVDPLDTFLDTFSWCVRFNVRFFPATRCCRDLGLDLAGGTLLPQMTLFWCTIIEDR